MTPLTQTCDYSTSADFVKPGGKVLVSLQAAVMRPAARTELPSMRADTTCARNCQKENPLHQRLLVGRLALRLSSDWTTRFEKGIARS